MLAAAACMLGPDHASCCCMHDRQPTVHSSHVAGMGSLPCQMELTCTASCCCMTAMHDCHAYTWATHKPHTSHSQATARPHASAPASYDPMHSDAAGMHSLLAAGTPPPPHPPTPPTPHHPPPPKVLREFRLYNGHLRWLKMDLDYEHGRLAACNQAGEVGALWWWLGSQAGEVGALWWWLGSQGDLLAW
jgi:hypothetical protein